MMNQWHMFNFALVKGDKQYVFQLFPGSSWEEIQTVLDEFKAEFQKLQELAIQQEAEKKQKEESDVPVEVVNA